MLLQLDVDSVAKPKQVNKPVICKKRVDISKQRPVLSLPLAGWLAKPLGLSKTVFTQLQELV